MLGKLSVPGSPTNLDNRRANGLLHLQRGSFGHFFLYLHFIFSFFLSVRRPDKALNSDSKSR